MLTVLAAAGDNNSGIISGLGILLLIGFICVAFWATGRRK
jgi:hypothetical protein